MFQVLSAFQFIVGFLLIFFGSYAVASRKKYPIAEGAPYYSGAYFAGIAVLVLSGCGGAVYHTGQQYHMDLSVWLIVHPVLKVYKILCPFVLICCCVGIALTGMFGLCHRQACSYTITDFNFGIAALLVTLELSALLSAVLSILVCRYCDKKECCIFIKQTQHEPRKSNDTATKFVEGVGKNPQNITVRPIEGVGKNPQNITVRPIEGVGKNSQNITVRPIEGVGKNPQNITVRPIEGVGKNPQNITVRPIEGVGKNPQNITVRPIEGVGKNPQNITVRPIEGVGKNPQNITVRPIEGVGKNPQNITVRPIEGQK